MTAVRLHPQLPKVAAAAFAVVVVVFFVLRSQASTPAESAGAALKPRVVKPVVLPPKAQPVDAAPPANPGSQLAHAEAVEGGEAEPRCAHAVCEEANCAFGEVSVAMPLVPGEGGNGDDKEELPCCPKTECEPLGASQDVWRAIFKTTKGDITVEFHREWAPKGVDRVYEMISLGFFNTNGTPDEGVTFFRAVKNFVVQFGIHGDPSVGKEWREHKIEDDPVADQSNLEGYLTFATAGKGTRTTQLFFNLQDNSFLDKKGFPPVGKIVSGLDVLKKLNTEYGEKPNQGTIQNRGNAYLRKDFPNLDYIISVQMGGGEDLANLAF